MKVLRVMLLEATPVHKVEALFAHGWHFVKLSARSASCPGTVCKNVKVLVFSCSAEEKGAFVDSAPTTEVFSSEEGPHGLAFPFFCLSNTPADNALAVENKLEEDVLCWRLSGCEHGWVDRVRYPKLRGEVGRNVDIDQACAVSSIGCVADRYGCLGERVGVELRLQHQDDALGCRHLDVALYAMRQSTQVCVCGKWKD